MKSVMSKISYVTGLAALSFPVLAHAQVVNNGNGVLGGVNPTLPSTFGNFAQSVTTIFNLIIAIAAIAFIALFLYGGIKYLTSAGDDKGTEAGRKVIIDAAIGLIIVLAAWSGGNFVLRKLGITGIDLTGNTSINQQGAIQVQP